MSLNNFLNPYGVIYVIRNKINDKKYIGQTTLKINDRCSWFEPSVLCVYKNNTHLCRSIKKYGFENFNRKIIDFGKDRKDLNNKEIFYIKKYNTTNQDFGYNIHRGGYKGISGKTLEDVFGKEKANKIKINQQKASKKRWTSKNKKKHSEIMKKYYKINGSNNQKYHFTKAYLIKEYWLSKENMKKRILNKKQKSIKEIAKENNCSSTVIRNYFKKYNILIKTNSEGTKLVMMNSKEKYLCTEEKRKKLSKSKKGKKNGMYGKKPWNKGIKLTKKEKKRISIIISSPKYYCLKCKRDHHILSNIGKDHLNFKEK